MSSFTNLAYRYLKKSKVFSILFLIPMSVNLLACQNSENTNPPINSAGDTVAPTVISTVPSTGQTNVSLTEITVTFTKAIKPVTTKQVSVTPFFTENGVNLDILNQVVLDNATSFDYRNNNKTLAIKLNNADLVEKKRYQVAIKKNISDVTGNTLMADCLWDFTTVGATAIVSAKTGVCNGAQQKPSDLLGTLEFFNASASNQKVILNWGKPATGIVNYFQIERLDEVAPFRVLVDNLSGTKTSYTDTTVSNNVSYQYRLTPFNVNGGGPAMESATVIPTRLETAPSSTVNPPTNIVVTDFSRKIAISPNGLIMAVAAPRSSASVKVLDTGAVEIYKRTNSTNPWKYSRQLVSPNADLRIELGQSFGYSIAFNASGTKLAVGEPGGVSLITTTRVDRRTKVGSVHIFTTRDWMIEDTLQNSTPSKAAGFGLNIQFVNADTLAINEVGRRSNGINRVRPELVHLFQYSAATQPLWTSASEITSPNVSDINKFAARFAINSDGSIVAIGEQGSRVNSPVNVGEVHIFTRQAGKWTIFESLTAPDAIKANNFGYRLTFSRNNDLAVAGNIFRNNQQDGNVFIFSRDDSGSFKTIPPRVLTPRIPISSANFGDTLTFNGSGTTLAVGDYFADSASVMKSGVVELFVKNVSATTTQWQSSRVLISKMPASWNYFGRGLVYFGDTLYVGEISGDTASANDVGVINIFKSGM